MVNVVVVELVWCVVIVYLSIRKIYGIYVYNFGGIVSDVLFWWWWVYVVEVLLVLDLLVLINFFMNSCDKREDLYGKLVGDDGGGILYWIVSVE